MTKFRTLALLAMLAPLLAGCFPAAVVGVGAGALVFADRRHAETLFTDEGIEIRAASRIREAYGNRVHVNVTSYNRSVLLTGEVPDAAAQAGVEQLVAAVPNVRTIGNELAVLGNSSLSGRSNDVLIASMVKARFIDASRFSANHVKVVTERGIVYLLGLVTQREADAAVEIARTTAGVQKVVRVMEIIGEDEAQRLDRISPPADGKAVQPAS